MSKYIISHKFIMNTIYFIQFNVRTHIITSIVKVDSDRLKNTSEHFVFTRA